MTSKKWKYLSFMTKVNPNNENETKSDIFPWDIFKSGIIFIDSKLLKCFNQCFNLSISLCNSEHKQVKF